MVDPIIKLIMEDAVFLYAGGLSVLGEGSVGGDRNSHVSSNKCQEEAVAHCVFRLWHAFSFPKDL